MANWSNPTVTSLYLDVLADLKNRDIDAVTMYLSSAINVPVGAMHWSRTDKTFYEWNGTAYIPQVISIQGGGTGASTPAGIIGNVGLGTMASQNANAVAITGGNASLTSITANGVFIANTITFQLFNHTTFAIQGLSIGSNITPAGQIYVGNGLRIPVGTNKYLTS